MAIVFGIIWFIVAMATSVFIYGGFLKTSYFKIGLAMIILSFICGLTIMFTAVMTI